MIADGFPNLALTFEPGEKEVMYDKPRKKGTKILDKEIWCKVGRDKLSEQVRQMGNIKAADAIIEYMSIESNNIDMS